MTKKDLPSAPVERLFARIESSRGADPAVSYTARLLSRGPAKIAQKLGEEAVETLIEVTQGAKAGVIAESADLIYHLLVAWAVSGVTPDDVWAELARREGISGIAEKASRKPS